MNWCFAIINNKLAEIFFEKKNGEIKFLSHCYVKKSEYKTKKEQGYIKNDTEKVRLSYKNGEYKNLSEKFI